MQQTENVLFGGGCFWCTEAIFEQLRGVVSVISGYAGGTVQNPTYEQVSAGTTGHAEVIQVTYDPSVIPFEVLLEVFFNLHDPTEHNRQGNDVGTQYRSIILYTTEEQKKIALSYIQMLQTSAVPEKPIVTEVKRADVFYPAEEHHQDFYSQNKFNPYCVLVINPKLTKLRRRYAKLLK